MHALQVRDVMVERVSQLKPTDMASVSQKASCLNQLTATNHTLTGNTQVCNTSC